MGEPSDSLSFLDVRSPFHCLLAAAAPLRLDLFSSAAFPDSFFLAQGPTLDVYDSR